MSRRDRFDQTPEDKLVAAAYELMDWVVLHKAACIAGLVLAAACAVAGLAYWSHLRSYNEDAAMAFDAARKADDYKAVTDSYPGSSVEPLALFSRGRRLLDEKRYGEAEESFSTLASSYPGHHLSPDALLLAGMALEQQGKFDEAVKRYRASAEEHPSAFPAPRALLGMGGCYEAMGKTAEAKAAYGKIVSSYKASGLKKDAEERIARLVRGSAAPAKSPVPNASPAPPAKPSGGMSTPAAKGPN